MTLSQKKKLKLIILTLIMAIAAVFYIYPVFLMFINSVQPFGEVV